MYEIELNPHQEAELEDRTHRLILNVGGYGSGKTVTGALILLDRSEWDTEQRMGYFANTGSQVLEGLFPILEEWLANAGVEYVFGSKAPLRWRERWERQGIPYPSRGPRSTSTAILDTGLHVVFGGLGNQKFRRFKGYEFGAIIVEELLEHPGPEGLNFLIPRVRCGDAAGGYCRRNHRHQIYAHANPPEPAQPHWMRRYVREMQEREELRRAAGKAPYFRLIQSGTLENVRNLGDEYVDTLRASLAPDSAHAMLTGDMTQRLVSRTYRTFSPANVYPVAYDPTRTVLLGLDFNVTPATATLMHVLRDDELPAINKLRDADHEPIGIFGEFFFEGGMDASSVALALCAGDHEGLSVPENFSGLRDHRARVYAYGDASGGMRRVESPGLRSAWHYVNSVMSENLGRRYEAMVPRANPSVFESVETIVAMLEASNGDRTMFVDPRCKFVRRDLEEQRWRDDGTELDDGDGTIGHLMDGVRYTAAKRYPNRGRSGVRAQSRPATTDETRWRGISSRWR